MVGISQACYNSIAISSVGSLSYTPGTTTSLAFPFSFNPTACSTSRGQAVAFQLFNYNSGPSSVFSDCLFNLPNTGSSASAICRSIPQTSGHYIFGILQDYQSEYSPWVQSGGDKMCDDFWVDCTPAPKPSKEHGKDRRRLDAQLTVLESGKQMDALPNGTQCLRGTSACPVLAGLREGRTRWECVDVMTSLDSCGGCPGTKRSTDCTLLPHVSSVSCVAGSCQVRACEGHYNPSSNGRYCVYPYDLE